MYTSIFREREFFLMEDFLHQKPRDLRDLLMRDPRDRYCGDCIFKYDRSQKWNWIIVYLEDFIEESEGVYTLLLDFFTVSDYYRFMEFMDNRIPESSRIRNWEEILNPESEKNSVFSTFIKIENYKSSEELVKDAHYYLDLYRLQDLSPKISSGDADDFPLLANLDFKESSSKHNAPLFYQTYSLSYPQFVFSSLVEERGLEEYSADSEIKLIVHNVGQGNMNEIKQSDESYIIFDAGTAVLNKNVPYHIVDNKLQAVLKSSSLPLFVLSHWHTDHYSFLFELQNIYLSKIKSFIFPNCVKSFGVYCFIAKLNLLGKAVTMQKLQHVKPWEKRQLNDKVILFANKYVKTNINNSGLTLFVQGDENNAMLPGDCNYRIAEGQANDIITHPMGNHIHYLVIPHHGGLAGKVSYNIKNAPCRQGIISVGENDYGHPMKDVIAQAEKYLVKPIESTLEKGEDISKLL